MRCLVCLAWLVAGGLVLALAVVVSGIVPAKASSGHWPWTAWLLEFAMERSVATNSSGIEAPELNDPALIMRGAGHYEVGCRWCHGDPQLGPSRVVLQMTPHPSTLTEELHKWSDEQLYYIVRHGVLFTGMPGWPHPRRGDEVWGVAAFLKRFEQLTPEEFDYWTGRDEIRRAQQLASAAQQPNGSVPQLPQVVIQRCVSCHGVDGAGRQAFPHLAGQKRDYLRASLLAYRSGQRASGTMGPIAHQLNDAEIDACVAYFAALPWNHKSAQALVEQGSPGARIAREGLPRQRVGACMACHGLVGNEAGKDGPVSSSANLATYPLLSGQRTDYLIGQLILFRVRDRGGHGAHHIMENMVEEMTDEQIRSVANYYGVDSRPTLVPPAQSLAEP